MESFFAGVGGFLLTVLAVFLVTELSLVLEEAILVRFELRKGFTGAKTGLIKVFQRHALKVLRIEGPPSKHFISAAKYLMVFFAAGCLPLWGGEPALNPPHSLWIFLGIILLGPIAQLAIAWYFNKGAGWPVLLTTNERTIGSATVLFTLAIALVAMTGVDRFSDFIEAQARHSWLVFRYPLSVLLAFAFAVVSLFVTFQSVFSRTGDARPAGWGMDDLIPQLSRAVWSLFIVDIFFGGAAGALSGPVGDALFILKAVVINVISGVVAKLFFQLREDQAEAFILWRLAPISIAILALSLIFPGGLT